MALPPGDSSDSDEEYASARQTPSSFQDLLQEAAKLKTCQLNEIRRTYEGCPSFVQESGLHCEDRACVEARDLPVGDAVTACCTAREEGNLLVKQGDHAGALIRYGDAVSVFRWFEDEGDHRPMRDRVPASARTQGDPECSAAGDVRVALGACYRNSAICLLTLGLPGDALWACNRALELDPNDTKALFRRAKARILLDASGDDGEAISTEVLRSAVADLKKACLLAPKDQQARKEYDQRRKQLHALTREQAAAFGGMFGRAEREGGLYTATEAEEIAAPPPVDARAAKAANDRVAASILEGSYMDEDIGLMRAKDGRLLI